MGLRPRDLEVLRYAVKHGFITPDEAKERFWRGHGLNHYRRLRQLVDRRLLAPMKADRGLYLGFRPTAEGLRAVSGSGGRAPTYRTPYRHDLLLRRVREVIEAGPAVSGFVPEIDLKRSLGR